MFRWLLCLSLVSQLGSTASGGNEHTLSKSASQPITEDRFEIRNVEGWTVYINRALFAEHTEETARTLEHLRWELYQIKLAAPPAAVAHMQQHTPIWIEYKEKVDLSYHPSRQWLLDRDYQIPRDPPSLMSLSVATHCDDSYRHPFVVFHEMAHGYDFHFTGRGKRYGNDEIQAAYDRMMAEGKYENILIWNGRYGSHYARSNRMEYWAETTEAYFAVNDFYPFVRAELREFDPNQVRLLERYWGVDADHLRRTEKELVTYLETTPHTPNVASTDTYTPTDQYDKRDIDGWTVYVSPDLLREPGRCHAAVTLVAYKLHMIDHFFSEQGRAQLHEIPIWLEAGGLGPYIQYCASRKHMRRAGLNPDKHSAVEIRDPQRLRQWALLQWSDLLHHVALGYYDRHATGKDSELRGRIRAAYRKATDNEKYQSVLRFDGQHVPHPALQNERIYFAEMTESYFLTNDHYPFVRCQLKEHDPAAHALIATLWPGCPRR